MNYKNKLQIASFRGVKFFVKDINTTMGRRTILHEYPMRDEPYAEDIGRKAREFSVNAYVLTPNDFSAAQELRAALETYNTPATFVHPTIGQIQCVVKECTHTYSNQEGGIEYFSVTFVETYGNQFPSVTTDTQSLIRDSVNNLVTTSNDYFTSHFSTTGYPDFIANQAIDNLHHFTSQFRSLINFGSARNGNPAQYSKLIASLNSFDSTIPSLIADPSAIATNVNSLNQSLNGSFRGNLDLAQLIQGLLFNYGDNFAVIIETTNLRSVEANNQTQLIYLIKISALSQLINNISYMSFGSSNDALAARDNVDEKVWSVLDELGNTFDDNIYTALVDAQSAMVQDVKARSMFSNTVRQYYVADSRPALVLSYEFLGDASKDADLIARNNVVAPLFVPPQSSIQVVP